MQVDHMTRKAVLTDFGLARRMSQTTSVGTRTMLAGTPGFQSPEQLRSESIGPPSDVYAFGGVMTVTLTEKVLWPGLTAFQIMQKVTVACEKPNTKGIAIELLALCNRCFTHKAIERPKSSEVLALLVKCFAS